MVMDLFPSYSDLDLYGLQENLQFGRSILLGICLADNAVGLICILFAYHDIPAAQILDFVFY